MSVQRYLPIANITRRRDARPLNEASVLALMESIKLSEPCDLLNPISVRPAAGDRWELIAGGHRLEAMTRLGETVILSSAFDLDDAHAELAMIDENLCRAELSKADRATQTARRKAIYEELHPETVREATLLKGSGLPSRQVGETGNADRFTAETAAATGRSERAVQRDAERGEKIVPEALKAIRGSPLDRGIYLDEVKRLPSSEQAEKVRRDLAEGRPPTSKSVPPAAIASRSPQPAPSDAFVRFLSLAADIGKLAPNDIVAGIPAANRRADLLGHVRSLMAMLEAVDEIMEGAAHA